MNMIKNFIIISIIITNLFSNSLSDAFVKVAEIANPAVVSILGTQNVEKSFNNDPFYRHFQDFFELPENYGTSLGSGVIIDAENGYILTNNHVVKEADEITVTLYDKREFTADVIGTDKLSDLALLQINATNLSDIELGDSDMLKVGEWVVAIGNPFQQALSNTVTAGIVSAKGRSDIISNRNIEDFIQHDAAINPGNSGGALVNLDGELIGINTAIATGNSWNPQNAGIGFAIPINQANRVIEDLLEFGTVSRGFLGVSMSPIDDVMARAKLSKTAKVRNLFAKGNDVTWKTLRNTYDLQSPASMVMKLRNEGMMIYENRTSKGVSYRVGTPSKAIIAAGINKVFGKQVAYSNY